MLHIHSHVEFIWYLKYYLYTSKLKIHFTVRKIYVFFLIIYTQVCNMYLEFIKHFFDARKSGIFIEREVLHLMNKCLDISVLI
jgi:GT2 family glycosyltransferase